MSAASELGHDILSSFIERQKSSVFVWDADFLEDQSDMFTTAWNACIIDDLVGSIHTNMNVETDGDVF